MKDKQNLSLAGLIALMRGDVENALTPDGIVAQEARGQQDFVKSEILPKEVGYGGDPASSLYPAMGIEILDDHDDLFLKVRLPEGWTKVATDHNMWSLLLDEKGRKRGSIFYKAAFYDRKARFSANCRYSTNVLPICGFDEYFENRPQITDWYGVILDGDAVVWQSENFTIDESIDKSYQIKDEIEARTRAKTDELYPDWKNPLAYWD